MQDGLYDLIRPCSPEPGTSFLWQCQLHSSHRAMGAEMSPAYETGQVRLLASSSEEVEEIGSGCAKSRPGSWRRLRPWSASSFSKIEHDASRDQAGSRCSRAAGHPPHHWSVPLRL
jgi:hypothetical protein